MLIGGALTAAALAFALVPTEALAPKPSKPLYFYVVPLLRIQVRRPTWGCRGRAARCRSRRQAWVREECAVRCACCCAPQDLLGECGQIIADADWDQLRIVLSRIRVGAGRGGVAWEGAGGTGRRRGWAAGPGAAAVRRERRGRQDCSSATHVPLAAAARWPSHPLHTCTALWRAHAQGPPNNAQQNLQAVVALLEDGRARSQAQALASEVNEYLVDM